MNGLQDRIQASAVAAGGQTEAGCFILSKVEGGAALHAYGVPVGFAGSTFCPAFQQRTQCFRLDELSGHWGLPEQTHLKIDVDGNESEVIRGAAGLLRKSTLRSILMEIISGQEQDQAIVDQLHAAGFVHTGRFQSPMFDGIPLREV